METGLPALPWADPRRAGLAQGAHTTHLELRCCCWDCRGFLGVTKAELLECFPWQLAPKSHRCCQNSQLVVLLTSLFVFFLGLHLGITYRKHILGWVQLQHSLLGCFGEQQGCTSELEHQTCGVKLWEHQLCWAGGAGAALLGAQEPSAHQGYNG